MESAKQHHLDEDASEQKSPHNQNITKHSWGEVKQNRNNDTKDGITRKRKCITESETSENGHVSPEKTMLIPKKENDNSLCADTDNQPSELCGLKPEFVKSLGIKPPLAKWVYVVNFICDKNELKEVFELAGHVIICSVVAIRERYANIMYSHPLEAVQAISMFNGQVLYGQKLKVTMINPPSDTIILPKGLKDVGPGLGFNGRPLRDIVKHYKKYTKHQLSLVDASLFHRHNDNDEESTSSDLDLKSRDPVENTDASTRRKYFKITNVEDLPRKDTVKDTSSEETQTKKLKCCEPDDGSSSDEETVDVRIVSNLSAKLKGKDTSPQNETPLKDPRANTNPTIRTTVPPYNHPGPLNYQPPMSQPTGAPPQFRPNPPSGSNNTGPYVPIGGPRLVAPYHPSGTGISPVGSKIPVMGAGPNGPMMPSVGPNGPMGPFGPPTAPVAVGPPAGVMGPMGPSGPYGSFRPPGPNMLTGPNMPPIMQGQNPGMGPLPMTGSQPMPNNDVITLQFRNLPPSTTFPLLCDKVSQCGQVLSLQLTTPGCAVARFAHRIHAERCFQFFNGKCIDGCVIEVRFA